MCYKGIRAVFIVLLLGMSMLVAGIGVMDDEADNEDWEVWMNGPQIVILGEENSWKAHVWFENPSTSNLTYTWTVSGEIVEEDSDELEYTFHTLGTWTIEATVEDEDNNTASGSMNVRVHTDVSLTVMDEAYTPLEDAYVLLSNDEGYEELQRTDESGDALFEAWGPLGKHPEDLEFSVTVWCGGYDLKTEVFTGTEHQIVLFEEDDYSPPVEDGVYVDNIRLELRQEQSVGLFDTAMGDLDAFLQPIDGPIYADQNESIKELIRELDSYRSYTELSLNTAWTEPSRVELDTVGNGDPGDFVMNPFSIQEIRHALNYLINRQQIVDEVYGGRSIPMYQSISPLNDYYDRELRMLDESFGFTPEGNFDHAYNMIQDAMTDAMHHPDLAGDMRPPDDSPTEFWQYKPPGRDWGDIQVKGMIRVEDSRLHMGRLFSDLLEDCGIRVNRIEGDKGTITTWLFTDPADWEWGFNTGGWISSVTVAYQHAVPIQFYTDYNRFMPGGLIGESCRYLYRRDEPYAQPLIDDYVKPLVDGLLTDEQTYWDYIRHISYKGMFQSSRIFVTHNQEVVPLNKERVSEVAYDSTTGWSQFFSPRTIQTTDGDLKAALYSWSDRLYMDNWNDIHGSRDYNSILAQRMSYDAGTALHPIKGTFIPMRADFVADLEMAEMFNSIYGENIVPGEFMLRKDYEFDGNGELVKNLDIPTNDDVWWYCVQGDTWLQGGHEYDTDWNRVQVDKVATAVTYNYNLGTWHSGHDLTVRDILAWHAFSKQLSYGEEQGALGGQYYHSSWASGNRPYHQNVKAIEIVDAEKGIITYYGNYTFPVDSEICGYYGDFPMHPWQLYEAVSHLRGETDYADSGATPHDIYEWTNIAGTNYVHWICQDQTVDFRNTLINLKNAQWLPPYISGPIDVDDYQEIETEIDSITHWQDTYGLSWISQGPFKIVEYDWQDISMEMERHTHEDGYPFPNEHWSESLLIKRLEHGNMTAPAELYAGEPLMADIRILVLKEYPSYRTRDLREDEDFESVLSVYDEFGLLVYEDTEPNYVDSDGTYLHVTIPGTVTGDWSEGWYQIEFVSGFEGQRYKSKTFRILYVSPGTTEIVNHALSVSPTVGITPLMVNITASAENLGSIQGSETILIDGHAVDSVTVPGFGFVNETITHTFQEPGTYEVTFGELTETVTVFEPVFEPVDTELIITPMWGTPPLEVNIFVRARNTGHLDGSLDLVIHETVVHSLFISAGESAEHILNYTFQELGTYSVSFADIEEEVMVVEPVPEFVNLQLSVYPKDGEAPLENVVIYIYGENSGAAEGELELLIDGVVDYTLVIPAGESSEHTIVHEFQVPGTYNITFHDLTETVLVVDPEKEEYSDTDAPLWILPVIGLIIVLLTLMYYIYKSTRRPKSMGVYDEDVYGDEILMEDDKDAEHQEEDI